jgi:hypothetical protein
MRDSHPAKKIIQDDTKRKVKNRAPEVWEIYVRDQDIKIVGNWGSVAKNRKAFSRLPNNTAGYTAAAAADDNNDDGNEEEEEEEWGGGAILTNSIRRWSSDCTVMNLL